MRHEVRAIDLDPFPEEHAIGVTEVVAIRYRKSVMVVLTMLNGRQFTGTAVHPVEDTALSYARRNAMWNRNRLIAKWETEGRWPLQPVEGRHAMPKAV